ncbi:hypothetical protein MN608_00098 [Microdochium nivale]|nr:hypothetical protein MN608_00098 [Microdochium nivale]
MKFTIAIVSLLGAGAALATLAPAANGNNNDARVERSNVVDNVKRHDRAPGYADADIPANARGRGGAAHVIREMM